MLFRSSSGEVLDDTSSSQHAALLWIAADDDLSRITAESSINEIRQLRARYILACMYYSLNGDSWLSKLGWLDGSDDHCNWEYITCDATTGAVTELNSGGDVNMQGSIPSEALHLTSLGESQSEESPKFLVIPYLTCALLFQAELLLEATKLLPFLRSMGERAT